MSDMPNKTPPKTKKEMFERLVEISQHGIYEMPQERYKGTGAPGLFLEDLLGLSTGNRDIPDSIGWELKYYNAKTNLITLFHKEPQPKGIMRYMVSKFGWKDQHGRLSFRHTISGKSDRFRVVQDANQIIVRPLQGDGPNPYWTADDILGAVGGKLRRLVLAKGTRRGQEVQYTRVDYYETVQLTEFLYEVVRGTVKIDFDVREATPGSTGLRNHGTKFRVSPDDVGKLYAKKDRLC